MSKFIYQARALRKILEMNNLTGRNFAELIGVSEVFVSKMVNGEKGFPLERLSRLGVNLSKAREYLKGAILADFTRVLDLLEKGLPTQESSGKARVHEKSKVKTKSRALRKTSAHKS